MDKRQKMMQQWYLDEEIKIIQELHKTYSEALKDINRNIKKQMERFDPETGDLPQSAIYQIKYQQMLKGQVEDVLNNLQTSQYLLMSDYLDGCYEDGFVGSVFDMHGQGVPLMMPIDRNAMVQAVTLDSKISKGLYTRLGEDITALKKKITSEVSRSILNGTSYAETARQLAGITRIGYNNAIRITRTEGHRIQVTATMDAMEAAKDRGADVVKQWDSTLDGRTRPSHRRVDGEIRELDESFSNGLKFPGDADGRAAEVINCRCALLERARWAVGSGFTKRNNFTGELETFDTPDDYAKFKKDFFSNENVKYMNYVQQMQNKYGTSNFHKVLEQMTDREYKHYSKLLNDNPIYSKVTVATEQVSVRLTDLLSECKTTGDISTVTQSYFRDKVGSKIHTVDFGKCDVDAAKEMAAMLDELDDTYKSSLVSVRVTYMSDMYGGKTTPTRESFQKFIDTGDHSVLESHMELNENILRSKKAIENSFKADSRSQYGVVAPLAWVDEKYASVSTLVHEYGHTICPGKANEIYQSMTGGFHPDFMSLRRQYNMYMRDLHNKQSEIQAIRDSFTGQPDGLRLGIEAAKDVQAEYDAMCISRYSKDSVGEFIAEAFCDALLNSNPKPASVKVLETIMKIYGKGE